MDSSHYYDLRAMARNEADMLKVDYIMNYYIPAGIRKWMTLVS